ncbi:MAG: MDR family oxidoreductase [Pseudomonadota bacterium]
MADPFRGWVIERAREPGVFRTDLTVDDLSEGDVLVDVAYSSLNYKDGMAMTAKGPIIRSFPLVPGIDLAGTVIESQSAKFKPGDEVLLNGYGVGEKHSGGYAERARLRADWLLKVHEPLSMRQVMAVGTAGFTAMLSVQALELQGVPRGAEVLVTGAAGGVGSMSIVLLAAAGYRPVAATGRQALEGYLRELGAVDVVGREEVGAEVKGPLGSARWPAAIDSVGGAFLANVLKSMAYEGVVAVCGLAGGGDLPTSVYPFILRGVRLIGIDSVMLPMFKRDAAWGRLSVLLDTDKLDKLTEVIALKDVPAAAEKIMAGQVRGRVVVDVKA